jgi:hypothetical protein
MWWQRSMLFSLVPLLSATALAQFPTTPTPTPRPGSRQANLPGAAADSVDYDRLRSVEMMIPRDRIRSHPLLDPKKGIYRKPSKEEIEILAVAEPLLSRYAAFLKEPNTGIVKLNGESSCVTDKDVVAASEKCIPFKMPGAGTAFSFRTESYRLPRLADVILIDNIFRTGGVFQQVVMADLGDVAVEDLTLDSKGMKFLQDLKPAENSTEFMKLNAEMAKGAEFDGIFYRNGHPLKENSSYALRSLAYRGQYVRTIEGIQYDELEFDKRRDVIVAFRVVDKDQAGNVTIVWKRLRDLEAPKLKVKK